MGTRWHPAMRLALGEARAAVEHGDVPIGAVVLDADGAVVAAAHNERELTGDPTAHAEMLAIRRASRSLSQSPGSLSQPARSLSSSKRPERSEGEELAAGASWRLEDCTLVVTLEPCTMCAGALVASRVGRLVFGAYDPKAGAVASLFDVVRDPRLNHRVEVTGGVLADECGELLRDFFASHRSPSSAKRPGRSEG